MTASETRPAPALTRRLLERFGNPLEWNDIDKALLIQAIQVPMTFGLLLRGRHLLAHPDLEPYFDRGTLAILVRILVAHIAFAGVLAAVGLWVRRTSRGTRAYMYVAVQYWWLAFGIIAYIHGPPTTPVWAIFPIVGFFTLLLFDLPVALSGFATALLVLYGTAIGERLGRLPYAPLFRGWPMADGRVADAWFWSSMAWPVVASGVTFAVFVMILRLNRRQADDLAAATDRLRGDVDEATRYVRSMLPPPLDGTGGVAAEWTFLPSAALGGDAFTYQWIDDEHFMVALLDVCGHGVGAALHGISVLHALRPSAHAGVDVRDPAAVVAAMNAAYQMEAHDGLFLTLWYGVYHRPSRRLRYTTGGHPPAILLTGASRETARMEELATRGLAVGVADDAIYEVAEVELDRFAELYVFSDGAFEIDDAAGRLLPWPEWLAALTTAPANGGRRTDAVLAFCRARAGHHQLDDDFSLVRLVFGGT